MLSEAQSTRRLQELGARYYPEHNAPGKQVYYSGRHDVWIERVRSGRMVRLAIYEGCPC
jgi:hypothetical protein